MSAFNFKQAFGREKPHSSVTDWVEIMTSAQTGEESFEGMPEIVDAINLQSSGPSEAARALRKKMKHGEAHQQYRAIVIMRLLLDNIPDKMKNAFADHQFLDIIKSIWVDPFVDKRVKKRLTSVLLVWQEQYRGDPNMAVFEGLYAQLKKEKKPLLDDDIMTYLGHPASDAQKKSREQKAAARAQENNKESSGDRKRRRSFNFEKDKPKVMASIVEASQASSSLVNAIMLVNLDTESLQDNQNVQNCLIKARAAKRTIARYTQLVEHEELIGTLIEVHERLDSVLTTYEALTTTDEAAITSGLAKTTITEREIQADQTPAIERTGGLDDSEKGKARTNNPYAEFVHPDLADLDLGSGSKNLPPPLKPTAFSGEVVGREGHDKQGSLSDFSDYESSEDEGHIGSSKRDYVTVSDDPDDDLGSSTKQVGQTGLTSKVGNKNPFADPFADQGVPLNAQH